MSVFRLMYRFVFYRERDRYLLINRQRSQFWKYDSRYSNVNNGAQFPFWRGTVRGKILKREMSKLIVRYASNRKTIKRYGNGRCTRWYETARYVTDTLVNSDPYSL